jgi:hypothetical protein
VSIEDCGATTDYLLYGMVWAPTPGSDSPYRFFVISGRLVVALKWISNNTLEVHYGAGDGGFASRSATWNGLTDVIERDGFVLTVTADKDGVDRVSDAMAQVGASDISVLREQGESLRRVTLRRDEDT